MSFNIFGDVQRAPIVVQSTNRRINKLITKFPKSFYFSAYKRNWLDNAYAALIINAPSISANLL